MTFVLVFRFYYHTLVSFYLKWLPSIEPSDPFWVVPIDAHFTVLGLVMMVIPIAHFPLSLTSRSSWRLFLLRFGQSGFGNLISSINGILSLRDSVKLIFTCAWLKDKKWPDSMIDFREILRKIYIELASLVCAQFPWNVIETRSISLKGKISLTVLNI